MFRRFCWGQRTLDQYFHPVQTSLRSPCRRAILARLHAASARCCAARLRWRAMPPAPVPQGRQLQAGSQPQAPLPTPSGSRPRSPSSRTSATGPQPLHGSGAQLALSEEIIKLLQAQEDEAGPSTSTSFGSGSGSPSEPSGAAPVPHTPLRQNTESPAGRAPASPSARIPSRSSIRLRWTRAKAAPDNRPSQARHDENSSDVPAPYLTRIDCRPRGAPTATRSSPASPAAARSSSKPRPG